MRAETSEDEFSRFCAGSQGRLLRALSLAAASPQDAEDALQEAYVRAAGRWERLDDPEAWVRRVAVNLLRDGHRRAAAWERAARRLSAPRPAPPLGPDTVLVVDAVRQLPPEQRQAVALNYLLDLTVEQVAADLDRPVGTVKAQLARARARLACLLVDQEVAT